VTVNKVTSPAGSPGTFQYTLADSGPIFGVPLADIPEACSETGSNLNTCIGTLVAGDTDEIMNLLEDDDYTLIESDMPSNFGLTSIVCTTQGGTVFTITEGGVFTVEAGKTTACVITNTVQTGLFRLIKTVVNGFGLTQAPTDFKYQLNGGVLTAFVQGTGGASCTAPNADSVCQQFTFNVGDVISVVEPAEGQLPGYTASASTDCTSATIVAGAPKICTITNTAQQNTASATTQQRVLLFDRATVSGLRRAAGDTGTMSVTFSAYTSLEACNAQTGALGVSEAVTLVFPNATDTSIQVGTAGTNQIEIKRDTNGGGPGGAVTTVRWWRAAFNQTGTSPANAPFTTSCNEITTVTLEQ
jgi:hypothetical protein